MDTDTITALPEPKNPERLPGRMHTVLEHWAAHADEKNEAGQAQKIAEVMDDLPPAIQAALVAMIWRDPRIGSSIADAQAGSAEQIIKAVETGYSAGQQLRQPKIDRPALGPFTGRVKNEGRHKNKYLPLQVSANDLTAHFPLVAEGAYALAMTGTYHPDDEPHAHDNDNESHMLEDVHNAHSHLHRPSDRGHAEEQRERRQAASSPVLNAGSP